MSQPLTPLVDFSRKIVLTEFDPSQGVYLPVTTGTVTCYLATSDDAASAADPSLTGTATYIGNVAGVDPGTWFFGIDASALTFVLLDSLFLDVNDKPLPAYFVVLKPNGVRAVEKLKYTRVKKAALA